MGFSLDGVDDYVNGAGRKKGFNYSLKIMFFPRPLTHEEIVMLYEGRMKPVRCRRCDCYFVDRSELMRHVWIRHKAIHGYEDNKRLPEPLKRKLKRKPTP